MTVVQDGMVKNGVQSFLYKKDFKNIGRKGMKLKCMH